MALMPSTFGKNLRRLRNQQSPPLKSNELARRMNVTPSMVSRWETRSVSPDVQTVANAAAVLGVSVEELLAPERDLPSHGGTPVLRDADAPAPYERDITRGYKKNDVPVVGDAEASTNGVIAWTDEGLVKGQIEHWVSRSFADGDPRAYALVVRGDSMSPRYLPGEVVVAQPRVRPRDGDYACVQLASGERLIKRVFRRDGGWVLRSLNPAYPDREVTHDEIVAIDGIRHSIAF